MGPTHVLTSGSGGDGGEEVWFLGVVANQLRHFHNPFFTDLANLPHGINLANVTSMPVLGVLGAPLTWLWGPIFTYNILTILSPLTAALAVYWVAGRWVQRRSARFVAGLLYGFSPYLIAQLWGHLFLTMIFVCPIMVLALNEILVRQQWKPWRSGGLLALCLVTQVGISPELLLNACIIAVPLVLVLLVRLARRPLAAAIYAAKSTGVALACAALPLGLFIYNFLYGESHITSAYRSAEAVANLKIDGLAFLLPGSLQKFGLGVANSIDALIFYRGNGIVANPFESGGYIGIPLVVLILAGLPLVIRRREIWILALGFFVALSVAIGSEPTVNGHFIGIRGPFSKLHQIPLLENSIASRWTLYMWLFLALLSGIILDRVITYFAATAPSPRRTMQLAAASCVAALACLSLVPRWPMTQAEKVVPLWFSSPAEKALTLQSVVITAPLAVNGAPLAMMWQSVANFNFTLAHGSAGPQSAPWNDLKTIITQCDAPNAPDRPNLTALGRAQDQMRQLGVTTLIATQYAGNPTCSSAVFTALTGTPGIDQLDVRIWKSQP
jgi:hypothetical protein